MKTTPPSTVVSSGYVGPKWSDRQDPTQLKKFYVTYLLSLVAIVVIGATYYFIALQNKEIADAIFKFGGLALPILLLYPALAYMFGLRK